MLFLLITFLLVLLRKILAFVKDSLAVLRLKCENNSLYTYIGETKGYTCQPS